MNGWTPPPLPAQWTWTEGQPPWVGRREELDALERAWRAVEHGVRQVVLVSGEAGAGKSRLLQEACRTLDGQGVPVLFGACSSDLGLPFDPLDAPLRTLLNGSRLGQLPMADVPGMPVADGWRLLEQLVSGDDDQAGQTTLTSQALWAVVSVLTSATSAGPLVLALEDLHWAGESVWRALRFIVERTPDLPLLIMATHREARSDLSASVAGHLVQLRRLSGVQSVHLNGFRTDEVSLYLSAVRAGTPEAVQRAAGLLRDRTAGNPFLLGEVWRELSARQGVHALDDLREAVVPDSVRVLVGERLARLSTRDQDTLARGAVVGDSFGVEILRQSADSSTATGEIYRALTLSCEAGLLERVPADVGRYRFPHSLAREAVLATVDPYRLATMHAAVARALERRKASDPSVIPRLAHHYEKAVGLGLDDRAAQYLEQAAQLSGRRLAHSEAAELFERSAGLSASAEESRRVTLLAAASHRAAGEFPPAMLLDEQVAQNAPPMQVCEAAVGFEESSWLSGVGGVKAHDLLETALRGVPPDDPNPWVVRARASYGRVLEMAGGSPDAHSRIAETLARRTGDVRLLRDVLFRQLNLTVNVSHSRGVTDLVQQRELAAEVEVLSRVLGDARPMLWTTQLRIYVAYVMGDATSFAATVPELGRIIELTRATFFGARMLDTMASSQILRCDLAGATRSQAEARKLRDQLGIYPDLNAPSSLQAFLIRREFGGLEFARAHLAGPPPQDSWGPGLAALYIELGMVDQARAVVRGVLSNQWQSIRRSELWPIALSLLGDAVVELGDPTSAELLLEDAELLGGLNLMSGEMLTPTGSADRLIAGLRSVLGRPDVENLYAAALEMDARMVAPLHVATTHAQWARCLHRLGAAPARIADQVNAARALADQHALVRVHRLLTGLGSTQQASPGTATGGLTGRELEVLALLAKGHSNREIATHLFVSQNTAANHVRSILMKTGTTNRTAAARYAVQRGLVALSDD